MTYHCPQCGKEVKSLPGTGAGAAYGLPVCKDCNSKNRTAFLKRWAKKVFKVKKDKEENHR